MRLFFLLMLTIAYALLVGKAEAFQDTMDTSPHGFSYIDHHGQFRFINVDEEASSFIVNLDYANELITVTFDDGSFFVLNQSTDDIVYFNPETNSIQPGMFGVPSQFNMTEDATNVLSSYANHHPYISQTEAPTDPFCHVEVRPGMPCPPHIGIDSFEQTLTTQTSAFCSVVGARSAYPYDGSATLEQCSRSERYTDLATFMAAIAGCALTGGATCAVGMSAVAASHNSFRSRIDVCLASFNQTQFELEACELERNDDDQNQGGGSVAPGTVTTPDSNPLVDLAWDQLYRCRTATTSSPFSDPTSHVICFPI
ncbi:hypothetical protein [Pseudidiomarina terrestris]|uniref:Uncharacterized protein n=2 Tax=Pseudidiomarina terrestris TaxID=2820060 RepID=A0ABT8MKN9_9GAMM|nr:MULTISPECIES: hypothetical protein [unclassified Pseudidiomarina]MDN7126138.1 hypothetical protein [Pseudidiomarina sp. 1APR75-33.1]MDN7130524.1 hypothetical protein [Pseudidiomarina sp. 1APR75-15]MDN7137147.1 hypothetical protein [Pseudidiomarina sp. 1ASP75-14]